MFFDSGRNATLIYVNQVQALTIKTKVHGCLEGVFALGQVYVLISRVTDPTHLELVGIPPVPGLACKGAESGVLPDFVNISATNGFSSLKWNGERAM